MATTITKSATLPITPISKYRALILVAASELGWKHSQVSSKVDSFTKGADHITVQWGNSQMIGFAAKGQVPVAGTTKGKLQRLQTALGKPMEITKVWGLSQAQKDQLDELASKTFKVMEVNTKAKA